MMKTAKDITAKDKADFLDLIYSGLKCNDAAKELGISGTQFRRLKRRGATHYDEEFAKAWQEAELSEEHRFNREEALRALVDERSRHSDQILVKRMLAELPEYEMLRHQNFRHEVNVKLLAEILPGLALDQLEQIRMALAEGKQPDLKALSPPQAA